MAAPHLRLPARKILALLALALALSMSRPAHALQRLALTVGPDFPHILTGELALMYTPRWTIAASGGGFAYTFTSDSSSIPASMYSGDVRVRFFPFQGAFFLGAAAGMQNLSASDAQTFNVTVSGQSLAIPASAAVSVASPYLTLHLGWLFVTRSGFIFGIEGGGQLDTHTTTSINLNINDPNLSSYQSTIQALPQYQQAQTDIQNTVDKYVNRWLPYASIRLGWAF